MSFQETNRNKGKQTGTIQIHTTIHGRQLTNTEGKHKAGANRTIKGIVPFEINF